MPPKVQKGRSLNCRQCQSKSDFITGDSDLILVKTFPLFTGLFRRHTAQLAGLGPPSLHI